MEDYVKKVDRYKHINTYRPGGNTDGSYDYRPVMRSSTRALFMDCRCESVPGYFFMTSSDFQGRECYAAAGYPE